MENKNKLSKSRIEGAIEYVFHLQFTTLSLLDLLLPRGTRCLWEYMHNVHCTLLIKPPDLGVEKNLQRFNLTSKTKATKMITENFLVPKMYELRCDQAFNAWWLEPEAFEAVSFPPPSAHRRRQK